MPLSATKTHTFNSRTPGTNVGTDEFPNGFVNSGDLLQYVNSVTGIAISTNPIPSGTSGMVRDNAQGDSRYFRLTSRIVIRAASASQGLIQCRCTSGLAVAINATVSGATVSLVAANGAGAAIGSSAAIVLNEIYRVQIEGQVGTTITDGKVRIKIVRESDNSVLYNQSVAAGNVGTGFATYHQSGKASSTPTLNAEYLDFAYDDIGTYSDTVENYLPRAVDAPTYTEEPPAGTQKIHTYNNRQPGIEINNDEHSLVYGDPTVRRYADIGGNIVARFSNPGGLDGFVMDTTASTMKLSFISAVYFRQWPTVNTEILNFRSVSNANVCQVVITPAGKLIINTLNGAPASGGVNILEVSGLSLDVKYTLALAVTVGTTTSNGRMRARLLSPTNTQLGEAENNAANMGLSAMNGYRFGKLGVTTPLGVDFDQVMSYDGSYSWLALPSETGSAGQDQTVRPWETAELVGVGTGTWTQTSGLPVTLTAVNATTARYVVTPSLNYQTRVFAFAGDTVTHTALPATDSLGKTTPIRLRTGKELRRDGVLEDLVVGTPLLQHRHTSGVVGAQIVPPEYTEVFPAPSNAGIVYADDGGGNIVARFTGAAQDFFATDKFAATDRLAVAGEFILRARPSAVCEIAKSYSSVYSSFSLVANTDGTVQLNIGGGSRRVFKSPVLALGTRYRFRCTLRLGAEAAGVAGAIGTGVLQGSITTTDNTEIVSGILNDVAIGNANVGQDLVVKVIWGKITGTPSMTIDWDNQVAYPAFKMIDPLV